MDTYREWACAAVSRAVKTGAQCLAGLIGTGAVGVTSLDWPAMLSVTATAMVLSVLTSLAGVPEVEGGADVTKLTGAHLKGSDK